MFAGLVIDHQAGLGQLQLDLLRLRNTSPAFGGTLEISETSEHLLDLTWRNGDDWARLAADLRDQAFVRSVIDRRFDDFLADDEHADDALAAAAAHHVHAAADDDDPDPFEAAGDLEVTVHHEQVCLFASPN